MTSGLSNCYESAADVRSTNEDTWLSRQKLSCKNCVVAKIGVDTAENEPVKVV